MVVWMCRILQCYLYRSTVKRTQGVVDLPDLTGGTSGSSAEFTLVKKLTVVLTRCHGDNNPRVQFRNCFME
jgi:hypothetical protein